MPTAIARERLDISRDGLLASADDVSAPGLVLPIAWAAVAGATDVEVTQATVTLTAASAEETFPDVPVSTEGNHRIATVPPGRSVSAIGLDVALLDGERLTVSLPSLRGGWESPIFASTGVSNGSMSPASPQGATLANNLLTLPYAVSGSRLRLSKVTGDKVAEFAAVPFEVSKVNLTTATPPRNIRVLGPDQAPLWHAPALPDGSPEVVVDLRTALEIAFRKQVGQQATLEAAITVAADAPARAVVNVSGVHGALLRVEAGITALTLDGAPRPLRLSRPLAAELPSSVVGDLAIRYDGLRILDAVSDDLPSLGGAASGLIVGTDPALRVFAPEALTNISPARIGIVGRAPEDCEIALEFVRMVGSTGGPALGPPAILALRKTGPLDLHWATVPPGVVLSGAVGLRARANRGRFFWMTMDDRPLTRIAMLDPDPGGRAVTLTDMTVRVDGPTTELPAVAFPRAAFGGAFPVLDSDLFLTIEVADLTLRYAR
jgi:hypothetical protein